VISPTFPSSRRTFDLPPASAIGAPASGAVNEKGRFPQGGRSRLAFAAVKLDRMARAPCSLQRLNHRIGSLAPGGTMASSALRRILILLASFGASAPALAHPHVWITTTAEIVYAPDGKLTGVRHAWTFDPAYSAFSVQGLDKNNDGKLTPDELQELAKVNAESLAEFGFFTVLKANGAKQELGEARNYGMTFENEQVTLRFELPLKAAAHAPKTVSLEVYDPTYFVAFELAETEEPVRLAGAPKGCAVTLTKPKSVDTSRQQQLSEAFFQALTSSSSAYGAGFASRAIVACP
jgi:ABC-type uncharacterized transport system substrate-binding protein